MATRKVTEESIEEPVEKGIEEPVEKGIEEPVEKGIEEPVEERIGEHSGDGYTEIKMGGGWYMTISLAHSDRFEKEYVELAKERGGVKKSRFNLNPSHVRMLAEALIKFADDNKL